MMRHDTAEFVGFFCPTLLNKKNLNILNENVFYLCYCLFVILALA